MSFIIGMIATALTFAVVSFVMPAISYGGEPVNLLVPALVAGLVNGFLKPIIRVFALPLTIATLGAFGLIVNAALLLLIAWVSGIVGTDFTVSGFPAEAISLSVLTTAFIGAIAISIVGAVVGMLVRD
jgi:putative membrane protein